MSCSVTTGSCYSKSPLSHPPPQAHRPTFEEALHHSALGGTATLAKKGGRNHSAPAHQPSPAGRANPAQVEGISESLQGSQNKLGIFPYMGSLRKKSSLKKWSEKAGHSINL